MIFECFIRFSLDIFWICVDFGIRGGKFLIIHFIEFERKKDVAIAEANSINVLINVTILNGNMY